MVWQSSITVLLALALLASHVVRLNAQPGTGGGPGGGGMGTIGQNSSTACTQLSGQCAQNGTSNYVSRNLTYNASTGKFTGTMTFNQVSLPHIFL